MDDALVRTLIGETVTRAVERVPVPQMFAATVASAVDTTQVVVLVDGDLEPITIASVVGPLRGGERVMVQFSPPSGALVVGATFDGGWQIPVLLNGWVAAGGLLETPRYRFEPGGTVRLVGTIGGGTLGLPVLTLPESFRPPATSVFAIDSTDSYGAFQVRADGDVVVTVGTTTRCSIACTWSLPTS